MSQDNARSSMWVPLGPGEEVAQTAGFLHSWMDSAELVRPARNVRTGRKVKGMVSGQWEPEHRLCYLTTAESRGYSQPCSSITMTQEMNGPHPGPSSALHRQAVNGDGEMAGSASCHWRTSVLICPQVDQDISYSIKVILRT